MRETLLSLLLAMAAVAAAAPDARAQPWPAPSGHRALGDFTYDASLTRDQVLERWGDPLPRDDRNALDYVLDSGEKLGLLFSALPPHYLMKASVSQGDGTFRTLYKHFPNAAARRLDQIDPCNIWPGTIEPIWGVPDYRAGSLVSSRVYEMANGDVVTLFQMGPPPMVVVEHDGMLRELPDPPCDFSGGMPPPPPLVTAPPW